MKPKIVVVGSSNTDMVVKLPRLPLPGETVIGGRFSMAAGGKGANQAVAAARAGGEVAFISKVGRDFFGKQAVDGFKRDDLDTRFVGIAPGVSSGIALIFVDEQGENSIGVASGSNNELEPADLERARDTIFAADILLIQLEIPLSVVVAAVHMATEAGIRVILNPAPAQQLDPGLYKLISFITPNEIEAEVLTGIRITELSSLVQASESLLGRGVSAVVITLGARGAFIAQSDRRELIPAFEAHPVDTTAAGDVFNGALAVSLGEKRTLREAVRFANAAAALSVMKLGAQPSAPMRADIEALLASTS
jgi:ribokinase